MDLKQKCTIYSTVIIFSILLTLILIKTVVSCVQFRTQSSSQSHTIPNEPFADRMQSRTLSNEPFADRAQSSVKSRTECNEDIEYEKIPNYPLIKDAIFVSIASYRDSECRDTLQSLYKNAKNPEKIYVGICEQNKQGFENEICVLDKDNRIVKNNVKVHTLDYTQAKGPTYARYYCSRLWSGQEYYFQIDSHTKFEKDWDYNLIKMLKECKEISKRPILTVYPSTEEQVNITGFPVMDSSKISNNGLPIFFAGFRQGFVSDKPIKNPVQSIAAGFMFLESDFLHRVPFDPRLSGLFQGEETLLAARLYTNGYDMYAPNIKVCSHHYSRNGPMYFKDMRDFDKCRENAEKKVKFLLGMLAKEEVPDDYLKDYDKYGLGKERTLQQFWKDVGLSS